MTRPHRPTHPHLARATLALALALGAASAQAGLAYCDEPQPHDAAQVDRLLRLAAEAQAELARGEGAALVARSGLNLSLLGQRYSHAAISVQSHPAGAWGVRQLFFACAEGKPRLFDQGLAGFVLGVAGDAPAFVSVVRLPPVAAVPLARTAMDKPAALALLGGEYSANANPFATRYQNCNQWVAELLAAAWGEGSTRAQAQGWLAAQGYTPSVIDASAPWVWLPALTVPWVHLDDHSAADVQALRFAVSLPPAIDAFAQQQWPAAERVELCLGAGQIVVRTGGEPLPPTCEPAAGDRVVPL